MKKLFGTLVLIFVIIFGTLFVNTVTTNAEVINYTVVDGDNLWDIAEELLGDGTQFGKIYDANNTIVADPSEIYPGQVLTVVTDDMVEQPVEEEKPIEEEKPVEEENPVENQENIADGTEINSEVTENNANVDNSSTENNAPVVEEDNSIETVEEDGIIFEKDNSKVEEKEEQKSGANVKNGTISNGELTFVGDGEEEEKNNTDKGKKLSFAQMIAIGLVGTLVCLIVVLVVQIIDTFVPINIFKRKKNRK